MPRSVLSSFQAGDTVVRYLREEPGRVGLLLFPKAREADLAVRRATLRGEPEIDALPGNWAPAASALMPLVHVKVAGDDYSGAFAQGRTMLHAPSNGRFAYMGQQTMRNGAVTTVATSFSSAEGVLLQHLLSWRAGEEAVRISTRIFNTSPAAITLEMLSSFSLGCLTPFAADDAPGRLRVHRFRSAWSAEGRLESRTVEELHLERSWSGTAVFSERFGQVGSMPVRGWFPFVAVEDADAGVCWGAQLAWAGSWQMEISRQHDELAISGGLADREFGHWMKTLAPGEELLTPEATVACAEGGVDAVCDRLTAAQHHAVESGPAVERELPIVFNEWATTWGNPSHERLVRLAKSLRGTGVRYLVIDAGWYKPDPRTHWEYSHGDWVACPALFPEGLAGTAQAIRDCGLIPGLWFELETCGRDSAAFQMKHLLLQRDGVPLTVRGRRFFDFNNADAVAYLWERVVEPLERCGFGYLKIDYNETLGIGCDMAGGAPGSQGEGLRRQIEGVYRFLDRLRVRMPELVIENCASGGHRHEPSMLGRTAMSSFSDAHELREIPIIGANLQRLMLPRQCQMWAVLHGSDSEQRLIYSLAAGFLGRLCLSGDIDELSAAQRVVVGRAVALYALAAPIIRDGTSRRFGDIGDSWRHPRGWQAVVRTAGDHGLLVVHAFADPPGSITIPLGSGQWEIADSLTDISDRLVPGELQLRAFSAAVMLLRRA